MGKLVDKIKKFEPKHGTLAHTLYDGLFTFLYSPNTVTKKGEVHIKDGMDLKRTMIHVVLALQLCYVFGTYNIGQQHFEALGQHVGFFEGFHLKLIYGLLQILPIFIVSNLVGLGIEFYYAWRKGHPIEEGYLVSGALIPLIMPPDIPMWILAVSIIFAVIIGKEAFGGTGMNIWNVALLSRVFVFFAYPTSISGDQVWVAGLSSASPGAIVEYGWIHLNLLNPLFETLGWAIYDGTATVIDTFTGATPLALAYEGGWSSVLNHYTIGEMLWGSIPGSIGETSKPLIIVGALMLVFLGIASWRIMVSMFIGAAVTAILFNMMGFTPFMEVPWIYHFYMGSFFFAMAFMATDPVTAAATEGGKLIYGFLTGVIGMVIRIVNPAYPEGWMLAILFMNTFAPLIDYFFINSNISKRLKRA